MRRRTSGSVLDISIAGDEVEQNRIQLEHNLQHTNLSLRLSSASDGDEYANHYNHSVEYPRHNSNPGTFADFASIDGRSRDIDYDGDPHSQVHYWSYRTMDDEEGVNPYVGGETVSTAAHHASALTISAGLGGGRVRRDISLSEAEYDPDRPLYAMIDGVDSKFFDTETSRSKPGVASVTFDPLVVENTAELDRLLESGHAPALSHHHLPTDAIQSPLQSSSSSTTSGSEAENDNRHQTVSHPRLSDALRRVSFSPRRPRSAQSNRSDTSITHDVPRRQVPASPLARSTVLPHGNTPTPRPAKRTNIFPSYTTSPANQQPEFRVHPPTPSSVNGSKFSKLARGITREIAEANATAADGPSRPAPAPAGSRRQTADGASIRQPTPRKAPTSARQAANSRIHLPDVTGVTTAAASPAKPGNEYLRYKGSDGPREVEEQLLNTLGAVQSKLQILEDENAISRRRVKELEYELEVCKQDVVRERTRILRKEESILRQQKQRREASSHHDKGKAKTKDTNRASDVDAGPSDDRYREVVEEKKALEALIHALRSHLTRLTAELSSHQQLLTDLRGLRESDHRLLQQKTGDIERLKSEVERVAGEVEVLRGVVEEGLRERRANREVSMLQSQADLGMSQDQETDNEDEEQESEVEENDDAEVAHDGENYEADEAEQDETGSEREKEEEEEAVDAYPSYHASASPNASIERADRTMRTDHATLGSRSSHLAKSTSNEYTPGRFVDSAEIARIQAEVDERRLERSLSHSQSSIAIPSRAGSPAQDPLPQRRVTMEEEPEEDDRNLQPELNQRSRIARVVSPNTSNIAGPSTQRSPPARPSAPTPSHAAIRSSHTHHHSQRHHPPSPEETAPFPKIRGAHLEKLFFSAPEHNPQTCLTCCRRQRSGDAGNDSSWVPSRFRGKREHVGAKEERPKDLRRDDEEQEDEGFAEGEDVEHDTVAAAASGKGKEREFDGFRERAKKEGLPPQTVVARVIRELEDDFTHYKSIYVELADQYKVMDAVSDVPRRNILAKHLREVVDILEQKGDQIAALYDLLTFKDKAVAESAVPNVRRGLVSGTSSLGRTSALKRHPTSFI